MTVYVDFPFTIDPRFKDYCHLWADNALELGIFARRLGLRREWLQISRGMNGEFPHYDISPNKRALALKLGAEVKDLREWIKERVHSSLGDTGGRAAQGNQHPADSDGG